MRDTQLNHFETDESHLTLEEMLAYIDQSLDPPEQKRIEAILKVSPIYAEALTSLSESLAHDPSGREQLFQVQTAYSQAVKSKGARIKEFTGETPRAETSEVPSTRRWAWKWMAVATVLVATLSFGIYRYSQPPLEVRLAEQYLAHYVDPNGVMSQIEDQAYAFYNQHEYEQAIPLFEQLIEESEPGKQNKLKMFLGVSLLHVKQDAAAIGYFQSIIEHGQSIYVSAAKWYLALSLLKQENTKEGKKLLEELHESTQTDEQSKFYAEEATKLLTKLK